MTLTRLLCLTLFFVTIASVVFVKGTISSNVKNIVYTRYVQRKTMPCAKNKHYIEIVEVFHSRRRPPPFAFISDEDLTRFVRCDYDPTLPGCEGAGIVTTVKPKLSTTTVLNTPEQIIPSLPEIEDSGAEDEVTSSHPDIEYEDEEEDENANDDGQDEDYPIDTPTGGNDEAPPQDAEKKEALDQKASPTAKAKPFGWWF